ncbi:MAG: DNA alkylation repair protein [Thermoleophilia bacterium]|nr:DNA alkylation repair protein [Thermoleophilia bacterium]
MSSAGAEGALAVVLSELRGLAVPENVAGMARYGISTAGTLGVSMPALRKIAKRLGRDHHLALSLWDSGIHEARILAALVDDPSRVTQEQMEDWVVTLDSWDVCDQLCSNLFDKTPFAYGKAIDWSGRDETFVRRAGFVLMAALAVQDKRSPDEPFYAFLRLIVRGSTDERNFVKKAVNWALRQIGKRNATLNTAAVATAREIAELDSRAARWVAADALRELTGETVLRRLAERDGRRP